MTPLTIKTILVNAPVILDSAARLIAGLRRLGAAAEPAPDIPATLDGLRRELQQVEERLKANNESDVEQVKLIEQLARQNEALAASLTRLSLRLTALAAIGVVALLLAVLALVLARG